MDDNNRHYGVTNTSIRSLDHLFKTKGYTRFCLNDRFFGDFANILMQYMNEARRKKSLDKYFPADVYTYINFTETERENVRCNIKIELGQLHQIKLTEFKISNFDCSDTAHAEKTIRVKSLAEIPTKKQAIEIGIRILRQVNRKINGRRRSL